MRTVKDIMSANLVYLKEGDRPALVRRPIIELGITAVPVLDDEHRPVGVISLRDVVGEDKPTAKSAADKPHCVRDTEPVDSAARSLASANRHHLVVVDGDGRAVGMVSAIDFLRELVGLPPHHPAALDGV